MVATQEVLLQVGGLQAWYGSSHVLQGIDFTLRRGEAMGLLGRNGMGKSTLIRTLMGHVSLREGEVRLMAQDASQARPHEMARRGIAYVPEGRAIFPNLTVRENLLMAARMPRNATGWNLERVMSAFPRLAERVRQLGAQLSGGEQQMLAIGRALLTQPELIILDEATEGLAPLVVAQIWRVISEIRSDGIASLIVDRDYRHVLMHVDHAVVLQKGQIVLRGDAAQLRGDARLAEYLGV